MGRNRRVRALIAGLAVALMGYGASGGIAPANAADAGSKRTIAEYRAILDGVKAPTLEECDGEAWYDPGARGRPTQWGSFCSVRTHLHQAERYAPEARTFAEASALMNAQVQAETTEEDQLVAFLARRGPSILWTHVILCKLWEGDPTTVETITGVARDLREGRDVSTWDVQFARGLASGREDGQDCETLNDVLAPFRAAIQLSDSGVSDDKIVETVPLLGDVLRYMDQDNPGGWGVSEGMNKRVADKLSGRNML